MVPTSRYGLNGLHRDANGKNLMRGMLPFPRIWRDLGFPEVSGLLGYLPKQKWKFRASPWEAMDGIPDI